MTYDVVVIGGGASGVATSIMCAQRGISVALIEASDRVLKKVLATGNGKCNFTNACVSVEQYNTPFVRSCIETFSPNDAVDFFASLGMLSAREDDRYYPYSRQASTVVHTLMRALDNLGVDVKVGEAVTSIDKGFKVTTTKGTYDAKCVVLSTGSNATTGMMSHHLVKKFGHKYSICTPSLTYLTCDKEYVQGLGGIRIKATATIKVKGQEVSRSGELLFKNNAISGIMVFELSSFFARNVVDDKVVTIDMAPDLTKGELKAFLGEGKGSTYDRLLGFLPKQLAILVDKRSGGDLNRAIDMVKGYKIAIEGMGDIKNAQVVSGGLITEDFDAETLESRLVDNLYATGEVLDVDGECGGFNLHFAWASAHKVAESIGKKYGKN